LAAAIGYSWYTYKRERPAPTLAIEATVVDAKSVPGVGKLPPQPEPAPPAPAPTPPPVPPPETQPQVEPEGPPPPTPEELAKREQEQKEQAERETQAKQQEEDRKRAEQEKQQEAALAEEKAAEDKRVEEKRLADEQAKKAQDKAEADRKAAEAKKKADDKRLADEKKAEEQAKADREADLRHSLDQELRRDEARSSGALASWQSQITARIQRAWLRPASARPGIECVLNVTQVPGGEVTNVRIGACNGDQAVRESIEAAVYRASPLPPPPDPTLFERSLVITFRPD